MSLIFGILFCAILPIILGVWIGIPFHSSKSVWFRLAFGVVVGLVLFTWIAFLSSLMMGIDWASIIMANSVMVGLVYALHEKKWIHLSKEILKSQFWISKISKNEIQTNWLWIGACLLLILFFGIVSLDIMAVQSDGIYIGYRNNFGDLGLHFHLASSFWMGNNMPPESPIYSGVPLRYPYLSDFYSALLWFSTKSLELSFELPALILGFSLIVLFLYWVIHLGFSKWTAWLACLFFVFNGGLGFFHYMKRIVSTGNWQIDRAYSLIADQGYQFGNFISSLWVTQRGLQFSFPMMLLLFISLVHYLKSDPSKEKRLAHVLFIGIMAGALPMIHGHSIISMAVVVLYGIVFFPTKKWIAPISLVGVLWFPQVAYLGNWFGEKISNSKSFLRFNLGWYSDGLGIIPFWIKNAGLFLPLFILSLILYCIQKQKEENERMNHAVWLGCSGISIFILANLYIFAPWEWDNMKILVYGFLCMSPWVGQVVEKIFTYGQAGKVASVTFVIMLCASAWTDHIRALKPGGEHIRILDQSDIQLAESIKKKTIRDGLFLMEPTYNQPIVLTGRKAIMGYTGHVWSHGYPVNKKQNYIDLFKKGHPDYKKVLKKEDIDYILYGTREAQNNFDETFLKQNFKNITPTQPQKIYRVIKNNK